MDRGIEIKLLNNIARAQVLLLDSDLAKWGKAEQMTLEQLYVSQIILESLRNA